MRCPYCDYEFDGDDLYNADLYDEHDHKEIECVKCNKKFFVHSYSCFNYDVKTKEDFIDDGGF